MVGSCPILTFDYFFYLAYRFFLLPAFYSGFKNNAQHRAGVLVGLTVWGYVVSTLRMVMGQAFVDHKHLIIITSSVAISSCFMFFYTQKHRLTSICEKFQDKELSRCTIVQCLIFITGSLVLLVYFL